MKLIEVPVPKNVKHMVSHVSAFAFQVGKRGEKIPVRLVGDDLGRYRGKRIICDAAKTTGTNARGEVIEFFCLKPTRKAQATHVLVRIKGKIETIEL